MVTVLLKYWKWFAACGLIYFLYGCMAYWEPIKRSPYYIGIGLAVAFVGNMTWLYFGRQSSNPTEILYIGLLWDIAIMGAFICAGMGFGAIQLSIKMVVGLILIVVGSVLLHL